MADSDSDEDLKRAIALSLEESNPSSQPVKGFQVVVSLLSDDEEETNNDHNASTTSKRRIPAQENQKQSSMVSHGSSSNTCRISEDTSSARPSSSTGNPQPKQEPVPNSLLGGFDRQKMEKERLARVAERKKNLESKDMALQPTKRKASISPPYQSVPKKRSTDQLSEFPVSLSGRTLPVHKVRTGDLEKAPDALLNSSTNYRLPVLSSDERHQIITPLGVQYPDGVVKKTWVHGCPRLGDDIKIEEVLQKDDLELAVLSSFMVDPDWVMSKLKPKTKVVMVLQAKTDEVKQIMRSGSDTNFRFCFPSMKGQINAMHSKLQLLSHTNHLRIVVPSANLVPYDWGETGVMENICFLIDLPRLPVGQTRNLIDLTPFATELLYFLEAMGLDQGLINSLTNFDFSRTAHLAFIHTIGGSHSGNSWKRTGYCGLGSAVKKLGLHTEDALNIDFVTASLGNITEDFIKCMLLAAKGTDTMHLQGDDGTTEFGWRTDKAGPKKSVMAVSEPEQKLSDEVNANCRIYFPTQSTVARSKGGNASGGTICFQAKWFNLATFPRSLLRDSESVRGVLMHDKIIYVRSKSANLNIKAWAYIGSANLSESAWGKLVKDRTSKQLKLNCRNWEAGVIFPVPETLRSHIPATISPDLREMGMDVFQGHVPVPMVTPGQEYGLRRPWLFMEEQ